MRRGSEILGRVTVAADTGERLGRVEDLVFDERRHQVIGLLLKRSWLGRPRVVPFADVEAIGPDAIVTRTHTSPAKPEEVPDVGPIGDRDRVLKGRRLMTTDGRVLGSLIDMRFDDRTGRIEGYEISTGKLARLRGKRQFVPAPHTLTLGKDFALVPPETAELLARPDETAEEDERRDSSAAPEAST
jgi:uncharacterized protein YrrD